jgi:non-specific serine/threonine protein kinase
VAGTQELGTEIAGHRLVRRIGRGATGLVYEAEHLRIGRRAALKLLARELATDERFRERFIEESRLIGAIDHPNIIPIYDAGEADGVLYIAMRLVVGCDLKTMIGRQRTLAAEHALAVLEQAAAALDAAHARDLVHRDVKPANILIEEPRGRVFLTDFGVARRAGAATSPGAFVGSVDYAAPEQVEGKEILAATDVYALGCVLFECLTGRRPFERELDLAVLFAHVREPVPSPSELEPALPHALDAVVATALAKHPAERYSSCGELVAAARSALGARASEPGGRRAPGARAHASPAAESSLPAPTTPLLGRGSELEDLRALLRDDTVRIVTLTGTGGAGKTRLAVAVAAAVQDDFPDGVYFVQLESVGDPRLVVTAIASTLGAQESTLEALRGRLLDERVLLVLDNFEHLLAAAPSVAELLAGAPGLTVLATSRAPLRIRGEHEFSVPPLPLPTHGATLDLAELLRNPAVALFVARAQAVTRGFELTRDNAAAVAEICVRLDGLPLAIELAAPRVKLLSPASLLSRLESRLAVLTSGARDLPSRHRMLRTTLDASYELLGLPDRTLFARLAPFEGGCTPEAAESVCAVPGELDTTLVAAGLESLLDQSLLRQRLGADGEKRIEMLQTVQEYALYRLIERGDTDDARGRHAEYYAVLAETAEPELLGPHQVGWIHRLEAETANVRGALAWSSDGGNLSVGLRIAGALARFWSLRGLMGEGRVWLEEALERASDVAVPVRAKAVFAAGYAALGQGDYDDATAWFEESLALHEATGDRFGSAMCTAQLAWLSMALGDAKRAEALSQRSLASARESGDQRVASVALATLADSAASQGDTSRAAELFEECLTLRRGLGDQRNIANALLGLSQVELARGDLDAARSAIDEALALAREVGDGWSITVALGNLGRIALEDGDVARARALVGEALDASRQRGDKRMTAEWLHALAGVAAAADEAEHAARLWGAADALREAIRASASPIERATEARYLAPLGDLTSERGAGRRLGYEEALAYALELTGDVARSLDGGDERS